MSDHEDSSSDHGPWGWFEVERLEPRTTRLRQAGLLAAGLFGLWAAHDIARWADDRAATRTLAWSAFVTALVLWMIAHATRSMTESFEHCQARVFRSRHLLLCSVILLSATALLVATLLGRDPFSHLLAHGSVTGPDLVDLGHVIAAGVCCVAAARAIFATYDAMQQERPWRRGL